MSYTYTCSMCPAVLTFSLPRLPGERVVCGECTPSTPLSQRLRDANEAIRALAPDWPGDLAPLRAALDAIIDQQDAHG